MSADTPELLPCPFCGQHLSIQSATSSDGENSWEWAGHPENGCIMRHYGMRMSSAESIELWNRRAGGAESEELRAYYMSESEASRAARVDASKKLAECVAQRDEARADLAAANALLDSGMIKIGKTVYVGIDLRAASQAAIDYERGAGTVVETLLAAGKAVES
jgi:predicted LPLAT superfamily acyltransferase